MGKYINRDEQKINCIIRFTSLCKNVSLTRVQDQDGQNNNTENKIIYESQK